MREILFRGKRKDNGEWIFGGVLQETESDYTAICVYSDYHGWHEFVEVNPETVGQYTGLTDKNGKRIFEGDIIKKECSIGRIISVVECGISYGSCGVYQRFRDGSGTAMLSVGTNNGVVWCEVIGNIHDNPELLKGE